MAVAMALFLKHFVVEAYKIPTGSMQPTLIGDEDAEVKDRILVDKVTYALGDPERWDVAVFRYPLDRSKNFVKRIAGIGPEELKIEHGDLWVRAAEGGEWRIPRRPRGVMGSLWKRLDEEDPDQSRWVPRGLPQSSTWRTVGRTVEARGRGVAAFRGGREPIRDAYLDGYPEELLPWLPAHAPDSERNVVGDLRAEGTIEALAGLERFTVVLSEGMRHYRFEIAGPAASAEATTRIDAGPSARGIAANTPFRLEAGERVRFAVENLDDRLALEIDGHELFALEIEPAEEPSSGIVLELEGEGADLAELMAYRDVHYTGSGAPLAIPAGQYFMLGDNTQDSSDSREWTFRTFRLRAGDAHAPSGPTNGDGDHALELPDGPLVRGNWRNGENPRVVHTEEGPLTTFVDEWGERHWFRGGETLPGPTMAAPFVPRAMIQGKALAVFWPLDWERDIWRLKWVN